MKKAYVKVKSKSIKKSFNKAYIVAAILCAVLCIGSFSFSEQAKDNVKKSEKIEIPEISTEEVKEEKKQSEVVVPQVTEPHEIQTEEVIQPKTEEVAQVASVGEEVYFSLPLSGEIICNYSSNKPVKSKTTGEWRVHSGIDIKAPAGEKVVAPASGTVILCEENKLTGKTISIDHGDGFVSTLYNFMEITVEKGNKIKKGELIGTVGNSAPSEAAEEPHIHFELKKNGKYVNPNEFTE